MEALNFWLILLIGVAIGMLVSMLFRWMGRKYLGGRYQRGGRQ